MNPRPRHAALAARKDIEVCFTVCLPVRVDTDWLYSETSRICSLYPSPPHKPQNKGRGGSGNVGNSSRAVAAAPTSQAAPVQTRALANREPASLATRNDDDSRSNHIDRFTRPVPHLLFNSVPQTIPLLEGAQQNHNVSIKKIPRHPTRLEKVHAWTAGVKDCTWSFVEWSFICFFVLGGIALVCEALEQFFHQVRSSGVGEFVVGTPLLFGMLGLIFAVFLILLESVISLFV